MKRTNCAVCAETTMIQYIKQDLTSKNKFSGNAITNTIQGTSAICVTISTAEATFCPNCGKRLKKG